MRLTVPKRHMDTLKTIRDGGFAENSVRVIGGPTAGKPFKLGIPGGCRWMCKTKREHDTAVQWPSSRSTSRFRNYGCKSDDNFYRSSIPGRRILKNLRRNLVQETRRVSKTVSKMMAHAFTALGALSCSFASRSRVNPPLPPWLPLSFLPLFSFQPASLAFSRNRTLSSSTTGKFTQSPKLLVCIQ